MLHYVWRGLDTARECADRVPIGTNVLDSFRGCQRGIQAIQAIQAIRAIKPDITLPIGLL